MTELKKCVLMKHGVNYFKNILTGPCCYNMSHKINQDYTIDPIHCKICLDEEAANLTSYRMGANAQYGFDHPDNSIINLEITPNINCNLTCKTCNETRSTSWAKIKNIPINSSINLHPKDFKILLSTYDFTNLQTINFSGGEPFLNNNIERYLLLLADQIDLSKTILRFSTNGTIKINKRIKSQFEKFKLVLARFSLDDVNHGHDYLRYPSKWEEWVNVWEHFLDNIPSNVMPSINRTVGILNINRLTLLDEWHKDYKKTRLGDPIELLNHYCEGPLSLKNITPAMKGYLLDKHGQNSIQWDFIKSIQPINNNKQTLEYIQYLDKLHNQSFKEYDPELYSIMFN